MPGDEVLLTLLSAAYLFFFVIRGWMWADSWVLRGWTFDPSRPLIGAAEVVLRR